MKRRMERYGASVYFVRWRKKGGRTWSRESRSMDPQQEIMPVNTPVGLGLWLGWGQVTCAEDEDCVCDEPVS